jgi:hypothetical protein
MPSLLAIQVRLSDAPASAMAAMRLSSSLVDRAKAIDLGDDQDVTLAERRHELRKLRPVGPDTADLLAGDADGPGLLERGELRVQALILG